MASAKQDNPSTAQGSEFTESPSLLGDAGSLPSPDDDAPPTGLLPGRQIGQYLIAEKIGEGGMGQVYRATDVSLDRPVAMKVMFCGPHDDQRQAQRFEREARAMARLSHPNLLHVYSVGSESGCHYFAMELLRGETLTDAIRRLRRIPAPDLMQYAVQIVSALFYVHQKGITHRDIKCGNIMLCGRRAVLMDFGLAKDETDSGLTSVGAIMGTPDYMPPEAAEGRSAGPPTDIYSFGVVLYEALSGQLPFVGKSAISIIRQHIETQPPDLEQLVPEIKPELAAIVHKCLEKRPEDRFADCPALARALWDIVPDQIVLDVAEGRVPGADAMPLENTRFGTGSNQTLKTVPRTAAPRAKSGAAVTLSSKSGGTKSKPNLNPTVTHVNALATKIDEASDAATEVDLENATVHPRRGVPQWVWAVAGFAGVILMVVLLVAFNRKRTPQTKPFSGQPIARKGAVSAEKEVLIEFKGGDADPKKWYFIVRRQKPDGSWSEDLKIPYSDYVSSKSDTELIFTSDEAQRKP